MILAVDEFLGWVLSFIVFFMILSVCLSGLLVAWCPRPNVICLRVKIMSFILHKNEIMTNLTD